MVHRPDDDVRPDPAPLPFDRAVVALVRAVLTPDQTDLLIAFDAIADPNVRHALIDLARAAAGLPDAGPVPDAPIDATLRRIRSSLRHRAGPPGKDAML